MCKKKHFRSEQILSVLQRFVESCAHILLSPNVWQYTGYFEAGKEKEEKKEEMNCHLLITSHHTDKGRDKNNCQKEKKKKSLRAR